MELVLDGASDDVHTDDENLELEILSALNADANDHTYLLVCSRVMGPSQQGFKEPRLFSGDAAMLLPVLDEKLRDFTEPGTIGNFRIRIHKDGKFWRKFDVSVEKPRAANVPAALPSNGVAEAIQAMQRANEQLIARVLERTPAPVVAAPVAVDPVAMLDRAVTLIQKIQPAQPPQQESNATALLEAFRSGMQMVVEFGEGSRESGWMDIIRDIAKSPLMERALVGMMAGTPPGQRPPAKPPQPRVTPPANPNPQQPPNNPAIAEAQPAAPVNTDPVLAALDANPGVKAQVEQAVNYLVSRAMKGSPTDFYADWIVDNWSPEFLAMFINSPTWFQMVLAFNPEAARFQKWFEELIAEIRNIVNNADGGDDDVEPIDALGRSAPIVPNGNSRRRGGGSGNTEMDGEPS